MPSKRPPTPVTEAETVPALPVEESVKTSWSTYRGTGHILDKPDPRDYPVAGTRKADGSWEIRPVGGLLPPSSPTPDLVELKTASIWDQGMTSECVAFGFSRHINARIAFLYGTKPDETIIPAKHGIYGVARRNDPKDEQGNFILDGGCYPREAALGMLLHGIVSEKRLRWNESTVNAALPVDVLTAGYDAKIAKFHRVPAAQGREKEFLEELERILASGFTVPYAQDVDRAFNDYAGGAPLGPHKGATNGGHYTVLTGYDRKRRVMFGDNSWGTSWGKTGRYEVSYDRLVTPSCSDFIVLTVIPDPRNIR